VDVRRFHADRWECALAQEELSASSSALEAVRLTALMERTPGRSEIIVGLIDGPVAVDHPDLAAENIRQVAVTASGGVAAGANSAARAHGTFVAGVLSARRGSPAPALCPGCTLLVRPIFLETGPTDGAELPSASPDDLAEAIVECIGAGARVINLSVAVAQPSPNKERTLEEALGYAAHRGAIVVAAAGNQGAVGSSAITRHPWVIPVAACDLRGRPMGMSNLGGSIGRRGLMAPGDAITSLGATGGSLTMGGTSAAAPFVTGTVALLWSAFPGASAGAVRWVMIPGRPPRRAGIVPPLLDAAMAYDRLVAAAQTGG
jgi:subtilisin family serine protease